MSLFISLNLKNNLSSAPAILGPANQETIKMAETANVWIQRFAKLDMTIGNVFWVAVSISTISNPIFLGLSLAFRAFCTIFDHEVLILSKNENQLLSNEGPLGNITTKMNLLSRSWYIQFMQKGLWFPQILEPLKQA